MLKRIALISSVLLLTGCGTVVYSPNRIEPVMPPQGVIVEDGLPPK